MSRTRVGVLISGRGSNLAALLAAQGPFCPYEIVAVGSNVADAGGFGVSSSYGVPGFTVDHRPFGKDRAAFEAEIDAQLNAQGVELVALAGFMRVLTPFFVGRWAGRLINIHPSLLPLFPGTHTHRRALEAGVRLHGCTVHHVTEAVDSGAIIGQAAVPVAPDDTEETLAARVLEAEHVLYPAALALVCANETAGPDGTGGLLLNAWIPAKT